MIGFIYFFAFIVCMGDALFWGVTLAVIIIVFAGVVLFERLASRKKAGKKKK